MLLFLFTGCSLIKMGGVAKRGVVTYFAPRAYARNPYCTAVKPPCQISGSATDHVIWRQVRDLH